MLLFQTARGQTVKKSGTVKIGSTYFDAFVIGVFLIKSGLIKLLIINCPCLRKDFDFLNFIVMGRSMPYSPAAVSSVA